MSTKQTEMAPEQITAKRLIMRSGRSAVLLDGVLSSDECRELTKRAKQKGYEEALVNIGGGKQSSIPDLRSGDRCIIDDEALAGDFFHRIQPYLQQTKGLKAEKKLVGLNERLRFLAYKRGGYFKPHTDGSYSRPDGSASSYVTVMIYLNDGDADFEGGRTVFLDEQTWTPWANKIEHAIIPKPGRVLIFDHDMFHAGEEVISGTKICIRTDVMYSCPVNKLQGK